MKEMRRASRVLAWKLQQKRLFGRPSYRWKDNIKTNIKKVAWKYTALISCDDGSHLRVQQEFPGCWRRYVLKKTLLNGIDQYK
jgi:hypothetical protein